MNFIIHYILLMSLSLSIVTARPPGRNDQEKKLTGGEPLELGDYVDYFEDFFPVLNNSTKLNVSLQILGVLFKNKMKMKY